MPSRTSDKCTTCLRYGGDWHVLSCKVQDRAYAYWVKTCQSLPSVPLSHQEILRFSFSQINQDFLQQCGFCMDFLFPAQLVFPWLQLLLRHCFHLHMPVLSLLFLPPTHTTGQNNPMRNTPCPPSQIQAILYPVLLTRHIQLPQLRDWYHQSEDCTYHYIFLPVRNSNI